MNVGDEWTECSWITLRVFYYLMAATAFLAASSRLSAAVMGRPLSLRIFLASWTLVPGRQQGNTPLQTGNNKSDKKWLEKVEPDLPSALM